MSDHMKEKLTTVCTFWRIRVHSYNGYIRDANIVTFLYLRDEPTMTNATVVVFQLQLFQ